MRREAYESSPLPISWTPQQYIVGTNEVVSVRELEKRPIDVTTAFRILHDPEIRVEGEGVIPSKQLFIPVNKEEVLKSGLVDASQADSIVSQFDITLNKTRMTKSELMIIDMLNTNQWKRPMYFAVTVGDDYYLGMNDYFQLTGMAYQIMPVKNSGKGSSVNIEKMYDNMMNKFKWGNVADPKVYLDENTLRMCRTHRMMFAQLANALVQANDTVRATKVLDFSLQVLPPAKVRHDMTSILLAESYYTLGSMENGNQIVEAIATESVEYLTWYFNLKGSHRNSISQQISEQFRLLNHVLSIADKYKQKTIVDKYLPEFEKFAKRVQM